MTAFHAGVATAAHRRRLPCMAPKLRTIRTAPRNASVTRSEVASVMKAIAEEREAARGSRQRKRSAVKRQPKPHQSGNG